MKIHEIQQKIKEFKDEVHEFHPLLEVLFRNIPYIINVENTHGNTEFGADFILSKNDEILGNSIYIGLVVKIGSITQKNLFEDIKRQINECSIKRLIEGGKREIVLSEIWVITNDHITQNAKTAIHQDYQDKNITFIENEKISELVEKFLPTYWDDINISEVDLINQINKENAEIDKSLTLIQVEDKTFYINQEIIESYENQYIQDHKKRKKIDILYEIYNNKFLLLEGGIGSGKSKLLRHLTAELTTSEHYQKYKLIPIIVNYIDFEENYKFNFEELLKAKLENYHHTELIDNNFLFLIDGFDEKRNDKENRISKLEHIYEDIKKRENWKVLLTSRFLSGIVDENIKITFCKRLELSPLSLNQTITFLEKLCKEINLSTRIIEDLKKSHLMKELPRSPISAILLAELLNENSHDLPSNMTELYSKYLELMLGRWDTEKGINTQKEYQVSERIIRKIALDFIDNNWVSISRESCFKYFHDYISNRSFTFTAEELFKKVLERSNILKSNYIGDTIYFSHRTFAEYYYAKEKVSDKKLEINKNVYNIYWMNIYFFYVGLLEDCPEVIEEIIKIVPEDEPSKWLRIINLANYFLAGFSTPYDVVEKNLYLPLLEASRLYCDIINGKIEKSPFSFLPEISLLWWIQYMLRESYSYEYFSKALDSIIINIENLEISYDEKAYALFFTSLIYTELGNEEALQYFLDKYRNSLPTNLKLGIYYEGNKIKSSTKHFKKQLKVIRKTLNEIPKNQLDELHQRPLFYKKKNITTD